MKAMFRMIALIVFAAAVTRALPSASDVVPERQLPADRWSSPVIESLVQLNQGALTERQKADAAKVSELAKNVELLAATPPGTDTDGGTADLAARVATAKQAVKSAISTMSSGLTTDYNQGKTDLTTLKNAIDVAVQDVSADQKVNLKNYANNACSAEVLAETARSDLQTKTTARDNYDPTIPDNLAYFNKLGPISQCDRTSATSTCPDPTVTVASDLLVAFKDVTQEYYNKDKAMQDAEATKVSAELTAASKLTVVTATVTTILDGLVNHCSSDGNIYNSAVDEFNGNNAHRGNMLRTLREIECMIDHIDNSAGTAVAVSDPASGAAATATSAHECKTATKTATTLQSENFADATKETFTCPTRASYVDKVKAVHNMQLTDSWSPTTTNCDAVTAHGACAFPMKQGDACAAEWSQHPTGYKCTYSQLDAGSMNNCYVGSRYKINMGTTKDAHNRYTYSDAKLQQCVDSCQQNYGNGSPSKHEHSNCGGYGGADIKYGGFAMMGDNKCYCYASSGTDGATVIKNADSSYLTCVKQ